MITRMIILNMLMPPFRGLIDCSARRMTAQVQRGKYITRAEQFQAVIDSGRYL
ncbi:MAG: hypothetical protein SR1Q7_05835 [Quinella sp. 1Q7]|nr:hypothetical protein [Quinella sp. 1Q7]